MAISTQTELKAALDGWLDHTLYQSNYDNFIALAEAWMNRRVRVRGQVTSANITTTLGTGTIPTDYLEWIRVTRQLTIPQNLEYMAPDLLQLTYPSTTQMIYPTNYPTSPGHFTIEGASLLTRPIDDSVATQLLYYAKIPALTTLAPTNWLLTAHPDLYLWAALTEAAMFGTNDPRGANWNSRRAQALEEIIELYQSSLGVGSSRKAEGPTP